MVCIDLNFVLGYGFTFLAGEANVRGADRFFAAHALSSIADFSPMCSPLPGRSPHQTIQMSRSIPLHGLCPTDLPRKPTRHSGVPTSAASETLPHGNPRTSLQEHTGRCQRKTRLANLCRLGSGAHHPRPKTLCPGRLRCRTEPHGVRARCHHHRPVLVSVSLGPISSNQGSRQNAHAVEFTRQHP